MVEHVALLVPDAALHRHRSEHLIDRLPERHRPIADAAHTLAEVEAAPRPLNEWTKGDELSHPSHSLDRQLVASIENACEMRAR